MDYLFLKADLLKLQGYNYVLILFRLNFSRTLLLLLEPKGAARRCLQTTLFGESLEGLLPISVFWKQKLDILCSSVECTILQVSEVRKCLVMLGNSE